MTMSRRQIIAAAGVLGLSPERAKAAVPDGLEQLQRHGRYLPRWLELVDVEGERRRQLTALGPAQANLVGWMVRDLTSQYAAFLGLEALALREAPRGPALPGPGEELVSEDALAYIGDAGRHEQIIMLNEAHNASRHRGFLAELIQRLHDVGFRALAAETFTEGVRALGRGSQLRYLHGWYSLDPVFAEAVRLALALGWRLIPYEDRGRTDPSLAFGGEAAMSREQAQAENLRHAMDQSPGLRILVFGGYGHIMETGGAFAARLKTMTGVDPFTIGQSTTGSFGPHGEDTPSIKALLERFQPERPVLIRRVEDARPNGRSDAALTIEGTDVLVVHPALPDVCGRPGWLARAGWRKPVEMATPPGSGPRLLQALHATDTDPAIPADQVMLSDNATAAVLYLAPGDYRLRLETVNGFIDLGDQRVTASSR